MSCLYFSTENGISKFTPSTNSLDEFIEDKDLYLLSIGEDYFLLFDGAYDLYSKDNVEELPVNINIKKYISDIEIHGDVVFVKTDGSDNEIILPIDEKDCDILKNYNFGIDEKYGLFVNIKL